tara:strand:- start:667 stop:1056 length:390 start_codon:yes stop_codon:yes gene_type:complete
MNGARKYCEVFKNAEQVGSLYILPHYHARGKTFRVYVLPAGEAAIENGGINPPLNRDAVEVYGQTGGDAGWSEWYGWIYKGPWVGVFNALYDTRVKNIEGALLAMGVRERMTYIEDRKRKIALLDAYEG